MKVGITYDLRQDYLSEGYSEDETAEFDRPDTIDAIENALLELGHQTDRIGGLKKLMWRLIGGERWDMVFNIAEGMIGFGREAQVPGLLDAYRIPYTFSDPLVLSLTLHKAMAKHVFRDAGILTPDFFVVEKESDIDGKKLSFPLFAKPVAEGTGKGINQSSKIRSKSELATVCRRLLRQYQQPVLVEAFLPGREFTVGILGTGDNARSIGVMEVVLKDKAEPDVYSYTNKENCEELVEYHLVDDDIAQKAAAIALAAYRTIGCRDAGRIDLRADDSGNPQLIEINPLAGIHPEHSDLCIIASKAGMPYRSLIEAIMTSALERRVATMKSSRDQNFMRGSSS